MTPIAQAASVLLARALRSPEVYLVRRAASLRFFGGFHAFPGGRVMKDDADIPLAAEGPTVAAERYVAAARELFEETGVLVARRADGTFPTITHALFEARRRMMTGELSFREILERHQLTLRRDDWILLGGLTTPAFSQYRFDTTFFVTYLPPGQEADIWPGELDEGFWTTAAAALERWRRGECHISPPTIRLLQSIHERAVEDAAPWPAFTDHDVPPIYSAPQVRLVPLRTTSLPPSTHTNAYLVGRQSMYLIDPGSTEAAEQQKLFTAIAEEQVAGARLAGIVLTHHHPDHIGAASACAAKYGVPTFAHPATIKKLQGKVAVQQILDDGDHLDLGPAPDGRGTWHLETLYTPGHASGHLAFYEPHYRLLFVADMVSTLSSVVIAPPDGDLRIYLESLARLQKCDCRLLLPAHGSPSANPAQTLADCVTHRLRREEMLLAALEAGPRAVPELTEELYKGLPSPLLTFAEWQTLAGLQKLQAEGRAELDARDSTRWRLRVLTQPKESS